MHPKFLYFDLGKVLVNFSVDRMLSQIAVVAGLTVDAVRATMFADGLMRQHETGRLSSRAFYEAFCAATGARCDYETMRRAAAEIFSLHLPTLPIAAQLRQAGYPMGILSNTCETHWEYCLRQYRIVSEGFAVAALSYRIGVMKPDAGIFRAAAELAGRRPEEIFFVDDLPQHVAGAERSASTPCNTPRRNPWQPSCGNEESGSTINP